MAYLIFLRQTRVSCPGILVVRGFMYLFILTTEYVYLKNVHGTDRPKMMKFRSGPGDARMPEWPVRPCP